MKDLYAKNYETLIKEIKEDPKKWNDIPMLLGWKNYYCKNGQVLFKKMFKKLKKIIGV